MAAANPVVVVDPVDLTDPIAGYLNYLQHICAYSPHTLKAYRRDLIAWHEFLQKQETSLLQAKHALARAYVAHLRCGAPGSSQLHTRSINRRISCLKSFYKYLQKMQMGGQTANTQAKANSADSPSSSNNLSNPWDSISLLPNPQRLPRYLSLEELQKLADACESAFPSPYLQQLCRALLELGFSTGARISELCSLDLKQLLQKSSARPCRAQDIHSKLSIVGKGSKQRYLFLGEESRQALAGYLEQRELFLAQLSQRPSAGPEAVGVREQPALFCNSYGARLQPRSAQRLLTQLGQAAGLARPLHPHLLRHSFATTLLNSGAGIRSVQELLGHSSLQSTQIYTHVSIQRLQDIHRQAHPRGKQLKDRVIPNRETGVEP